MCSLLVAIMLMKKLKSTCKMEWISLAQFYRQEELRENNNPLIYAGPRIKYHNPKMLQSTEEIA